MRERMGQRLAELNAEYAAGQKLLAGLAAHQASVEESLLRISGAIEVLEELLAAGDHPTTLPAGPERLDVPA
jgi:prefoldin subunit 5